MTRTDRILMVALWAVAFICLGVWIAYLAGPPDTPGFPYTCRVVMPEDLDR